MQKDKHIFISIFLHNKGFIPAGVITFNTDLGYSGFSYFESYIKNDYPPLNPATLNWRDGNQRHFVVNHTHNKQMLDRTFWELLPNENDWGNQVLVSRFPEYATMNNAQKLYFLGSRTVGGLSSFVKDSQPEESINSFDWLDKIREESVSLYLNNLDKISYIKAVNPLTSYGGVRPKCMFQDDSGDFWIAKFNVPNDPYDMAIAEHTVLEMSRDMGLKVADSKVLQLPSGENVFLSKRFDRVQNEKFHSLSLYSLAPGADIAARNPFAPGNPASFIQTLIRRYSDFESMDSLNIVTKMLLDIAVNNTDNHLRNLRVILNKNNKWELSPIFDVVPNPYSQNHTYNPAGLPLNQLYLNNPLLASSMSKELGVSSDIIQEKINLVKGVSDNWETYCDKNSMTEEDKIKVGNAISLGLNRKEYTYQLENKNKIDNKFIFIPPKLKPNNI